MTDQEVQDAERVRRQGELPYHTMTAGQNDAHRWPERIDQWLGSDRVGMPDRDPARVTHNNTVLPATAVGV